MTTTNRWDVSVHHEIRSRATGKLSLTWRGYFVEASAAELAQLEADLVGGTANDGDDRVVAVDWQPAPFRSVDDLRAEYRPWTHGPTHD